jgi:hypothetical protein
MAKSAHAEKVTEKQLARSRVLLVVGAVLILAGVAPALYLIWCGSHNFLPLSMPLTLARGQYTSPWFTPEVNDTWQIDLEWSHAVSGQPVDPDDPNRLGARVQPVNLSIDWKIMSEPGSLIRQGTFASRIDGGNAVHLGSYKTKRGVRQRIILDVHDDVQGQNAAHPMLQIEDPEPSLDFSYAFPEALGWAVIVGGCGVTALIMGKLSMAW